ncbi:hypothetical protein JCM8547_008837 [Rhodosporidiobolus lusitaniae]
MGSAASTLASAASSVLAPSSRPLGPFTPSYDDVHAALDILVTLGGLPPELAILILDFAEYHPVLKASSVQTVYVNAGSTGTKQSRPLLVSEPIPAFSGAPKRPVVSMRVTTDSKDQGFSSFPQYRGTREGSSSWFEATLLRPDVEPEPVVPFSPLPPDPPSATAPTSSRLLPGSFPVATATPSSNFRSRNPSQSAQPAMAAEPTYSPVLTIPLHCNLHASLQFSTHTTTLSSAPSSLSPPSSSSADLPDPDEEEKRRREEEERTRFIKEMKAGDRVLVTALAEYPMWANIVRTAKVAVKLRVV